MTVPQPISDVCWGKGRVGGNLVFSYWLLLDLRTGMMPEMPPPCKGAELPMQSSHRRTPVSSSTFSHFLPHQKTRCSQKLPCLHNSDRSFLLSPLPGLPFLLGKKFVRSIVCVPTSADRAFPRVLQRKPTQTRGAHLGSPNPS